MALGGDPPTDPTPGPGELRHAIELVELARAIGGFSVGVAAQPAGHPLSPDMAIDRDHLAAKLRLADFAVTQFFFEVERVRRPGGRPGRPGRGQAGAPRDHAGHQRCARCPAWPAWARRCPTGWWTASSRPTAGAEPTPSGEEGVAMATELCEQLLAAGRARPALLHAQPVERDPRDLRRPGPRTVVTPDPSQVGRRVARHRR